MAEAPGPLEQRHYRWDPPVSAAEFDSSASGLAFLEATRDGRWPTCSMQRTLDYELIEVDEGRVVFRGRTRSFMANPSASVHGAIAGAMLDSAMGCAVHSSLTSKEIYTTLEYKVNFVRTLTFDTGEIFAEGLLVHRGGRTATASGRLTDGTGKLYAHGTSACLIMQR